MSRVKRHDPINSDGTCGLMVEDQDYGEYVEYADYDALAAENKRLREALADLLDCPAQVVQATVPRAGIDAAPPHQVVLDVSVSLTRWNNAKAALAGNKGGEL